MDKGLPALKIEASLVGRELLVNGRHWESVEADSAVDETLLQQLTLEQHWALLTVLRKTLNKAVYVYRNSRMQREGGIITDDTRRSRLEYQRVTEDPTKRKR